MVRNTQFPEFERLLDKEYPSVYHEEFDYFSELGVGLLLVSIGVTILAIMGFIMGFIQITGLLLILIGIILCCRGLVLNRTEKRKYEFKGLSRKTVSEAIMYLDSKIVQPEELESPAPYHGKLTVSQYEFIKFVIKTTGIISWSSDLIALVQRDSERIKKRMILLPLSAIVLSIILAFGTYSALTSESPFLMYMGLSLGYLFLCSLICIARSVYEYVRIPVLSQSAQVTTSESQKNDETLSEIFTLLQMEYHYPLRFFVARNYPTLEYTGRTKTSYTLVRLKEAVFYPRGAIQNEMPL